MCLAFHGISGQAVHMCATVAPVFRSQLCPGTFLSHLCSCWYMDSSGHHLDVAVVLVTRGMCGPPGPASVACAGFPVAARVMKGGCHSGAASGV